MFLFMYKQQPKGEVKETLKKMMNWVKLGLKDQNWNYFLIAAFIKYLYPSHGEYLFCECEKAILLQQSETHK